MRPNRFVRRRSRLFVLATLGLLLLLSGCGGGSASGSGNTGNSGQALVSLTDAPGDFLSYTVDVLSLTLTKADGTVVQTLPLKTRVDLAQYADLTEFFTGATIPAGVYVSATMQVDYSNADIEVDDGTGNAVKAVVHNANGQPATTMALNVRFDDNHPLVVAPGIPALLDLDFNLQASNQVDMTTTPPTVTADPVLVADIDPAQPKPHRVRGPLASVDTEAGTFSLYLRPFHLLQGNFGRLTVATDANTTFEIDRVTYQGPAGLAQLEQKSPGTATVVIGPLDVPNHHLLATEVYAGSSVAFGADDVVTGNVVARIGNVLTVRGATLVRSDGTFSFQNTVTVDIAATTKVTGETLAGVSLDQNSVSVGQHITAFGTFNSTTQTLDATNGLVRLLITALNGTVNVNPSGPMLGLTLQRIDGRPISLFTFTGTGSSGTDANPNQYQVATGTLDLTGISAGTPVKVRGFVQPFGQATTTDDFSAETLINVANGPALLVTGWPLLSTQPFGSYGATSMMINLAGTGLHDVFRSGVDTVLSATPAIQPFDPTHGLFAIGYHGSVQVYTRLDTYEQALQAGLGARQQARAVTAFGTYSDSAKTLTSTSIFTALQ